jgi:DnaJ-class molecular chaperone
MTPVKVIGDTAIEKRDCLVCAGRGFVADVPCWACRGTGKLPHVRKATAEEIAKANAKAS